MKVEVTHWDRRGEEISSEIIDVGEFDRARTVEAYEEEVSQAIRDGELAVFSRQSHHVHDPR